MSGSMFRRGHFRSRRPRPCCDVCYAFRPCASFRLACAAHVSGSENRLFRVSTDFRRPFGFCVQPLSGRSSAASTTSYGHQLLGHTRLGFPAVGRGGGWRSGRWLNDASVFSVPPSSCRRKQGKAGEGETADICASVVPNLGAQGAAFRIASCASFCFCENTKKQ